jgi:DNA-binding LacI/PurR family transcriptional regulator
MTEPGRITSTDVASAAGVSRATVSYVLNDTPGQKIPETTRQRVREAATRLGYSPSSAARTLRRGRSDLVLYLLPDLPIGPTVGDLLGHLTTGLAQHGLTLVVHPASRDAESMIELARAIRPAAVLTFTAVDEPTRDRLRGFGDPAVLSLLPGDPGNSRETVLSQGNTGRLQVQHLADTGHQQLGYAWPDDPRVLPFARPRLAGVQQACRDLGLDPPSVQEVPLDVAAAVTAIRAWRAATPAITGVCCYNDETAMALIAAATHLGLRIPDDLAIIGVDDNPAAALTVPPLTTIRTDTRIFAELCIAILLAQLNRQPPPRILDSTAVRLIIRQSA